MAGQHLRDGELVDNSVPGPVYVLAPRVPVSARLKEELPQVLPGSPLACRVVRLAQGQHLIRDQRGRHGAGCG
jgi:hypothetical protein